MADFCKQCSIDMFDKDFQDFAGVAGKAPCAMVLCEGCGFDCVVDYNGVCISETCLKQHGKQDSEGDESAVIETLVANRIDAKAQPNTFVSNYDDVNQPAEES